MEYVHGLRINETIVSWKVTLPSIFIAIIRGASTKKVLPDKPVKPVTIVNAPKNKGL